MGTGCAPTPKENTPQVPKEVKSSDEITQTKEQKNETTNTEEPLEKIDSSATQIEPKIPKVTPTITSYTMTEVATANTEEKCWTVINDIVYDLTAFINKHPGGDRNILKICGKDGTSAFTGKHSGQMRPEETLATFDIGILKK